ncbi:RnfH family protein [Thioalkalivibrio sp. XN279]|uniref:RnfH family protein n=1 Tax=Thioalkalivibrio sp. XN279 TaxID=2714953 RepID=UPI0014088F97|nr:RnfH family protein [Thioalkalivibrio sp. XN279]NHA14588.1 RnfH family protein [Thioalkalivibrio sp. XN279]
MEPQETIEVEVAYARPERQLILTVEVPAGTTAIEAARLSGIEEQFPDIQLGKNRMGVFGKLCKPDRVLNAGDRVEIYRPLLADPRAARRELAAAGKSMGKGGRDGADED